MKKERNKIDRAGYEKLLKNLEILEDKRQRLNSERENIVNGSVWRNSAFYTLENKENILLNSIVELRMFLENVEIIEDVIDESVVNIGDILEVGLYLFDGREIRTKLKLVSLPSDSKTDEITEVTLNSTIGKAIYGKAIGSSAVYKIDGKNNAILILNKVLENNQNLAR